MIRLPPRVLAALLGALVLILIAEWLPGAPPEPQPLPPRLTARAAGPRAAARDTEAWVAATLARPLFSASRRPPRSAPAAAGGAGPGMPRLAGIMITPDGGRAIFAPEGGGKPLVLAVGAPLADTAIRSIAADTVTLASGAVLRPSYDRNRVPATTPGFNPAPFPQPGFPQPGFAQPGFPPPGFPPGFTPADPNQNPGLPNRGIGPGQRRE